EPERTQTGASSRIPAPGARRPAGPFLPSKPPPARHRPGARSARRERCRDHPMQTTSEMEGGIMWLDSFLSCLKSNSQRTRRDRGRRPKRHRSLDFTPRLEALEDRTVPSTFLVENLADGGTRSVRPEGLLP